MSETITPDICVIGGGSGGLSVAAIAAAFGVSVVLIEKGKMGGDCLNYGCVPSKALLASGKQAEAIRSASKYGIYAPAPVVDFQKVHDYVHSVIAAIEPNDSVERFQSLGVEVIQGAAKFVDGRTVEVNGVRVRARRFVIATGSGPATPPIKGLDEVPYLTNEVIFDQTEAPEHLIVIGGGPIGMEMAQAHHRLGAKVTVLEAFKALGKDDPELTGIVLDKLRADGIDIREGAKIKRVEKAGAGVAIYLDNDGEEEILTGSHLLVAAGRKPNVEGLGLENARVRFDRAIKVSKSLRTSNRRIYAIGDVTGGLQFTHMANYHAGLVIRAILFRMPIKEKTHHIPWVTYTDPEMAHVGLTEEQATKLKGKRINVLRWPYAENDRAQAEGKTSGLIKVIVDKKGQILGASIVGLNAGELINMWALAISSKLKISAMSSFVSPYPTLSEISKRAAVLNLAGGAKHPAVQWVIGLLRRFD